MKIFRQAMIILGWIVIILLSLIYGTISCVYLHLFYQSGDNNVVYIPALPILFTVLVIGVCVLVTLGCRKTRWDNWRAGVLVLFTLPLIWLAIDAPPVENDYTRADIAPPSKESEKSYDVFMTYRKGEGPYFSIDAPHVTGLEAITNALPYAEEIEKAWNDISTGRDYIEKLDTFDQIVDLIPSIPLDYETPTIEFITLRTIAQIYWAYAALKTEEGKPEEGARYLVQLHSVCRKALPNCATLLSKMIWTAIAGGNIQTAYHIANRPNCTLETWKILKNGFKPLTKEDMSLRRPLIAEYLLAKNVCESYLTVTNLFDVFTGTTTELQKPSQRFLKNTFSRIILLFCFNRNRTIRDFKIYHDPIIAGATKYPPDISSTTNMPYTQRLQLRNPAGQLLVSIARPPFWFRSTKAAFDKKVLSDLLAIYLSERLGDKIELTDPYTGKPYIIDEKTGIAISAGPDGISDTEDDIKLGYFPP